ncbi:hypothetical protein SASPL_100114 [Salvia splendens]|uniref:Flavonoid 3'-monooxygenase n=1 Tax=Salvia splendens TaxID=180675 RepID=A0A8X8YNK8_SALSN|nr:hypothetical protein SASPL_100114 [Salvia splendens]
MAKQFLKVHDANFATRPALAAGKYTAYNYSDMTWSPYGPYWRQARKIFLSEVFHPNRLEFFKPVRDEEGRAFLSRLHALSGKPVLLRGHLSRFTLSNISRMVVSNKYFGDGEGSVFELGELQGMLDEWFLLNRAFNVGDWIPWLGFLDLQGYVGRMKELYKKLDRFNEHVIDDHQARRSDEKFTPKDLVDVLLVMAEKPDLEDLLTGGTDTSAKTVEWAIHEVMRHPRVAEKVREELDRVIGRERWVEESDYSRLPYIDMMVSNFSFLPFSSGRRRCPGHKLGLKLVRTTLANLLHGFDLRLVEGMKPQDVCLEELYGLTVHPKEPLQLIMEPRLPSHLF